MPEFTPTPEQTRLLEHVAGHHARVLAGPGTGKSASLVALVDKLLRGPEPPRVKLLTFTRAATAELGLKVSDHPLLATERPSTIHSFAISVLLQNPGAGGFPEPLRMADDWENRNVVLPTLRDRSGIPIKRLDLLLREMAANWESLQESQDPRITPQERGRFLGVWNEHRRIFGYAMLSELPNALRKALGEHPDLRGLDYDLLVVDEYQDLNACDLEVLRRVAERGSAVVGAGDDDQSIYSFRKAAPEGIRRFLNDYPASDDYSLSISMRCGRRILEWANHVIAGDPDRPQGRAFVRPQEGSPEGDVALLAFPGHVAEARGVAALVKALVEREGLSPSEILILLRTDHNGIFSSPIKDELAAVGIPFTDADIVEKLLGESNNRRFLEQLRLLVHREDSLAWASLLCLANGIGTAFLSYVYEKARPATTPFGHMLLELYRDGFPGAPAGPARRAKAVIAETLGWIDGHELPDEPPEHGWGDWIATAAGGGAAISEDFSTLLRDVDAVVETAELGRYLSQIQPLGEDIARATSQGVRIMTMMGSKGLTVRASILVGVEDGLVPRPGADLGEERRILYVAMTRAKEFLYLTWARRRYGPQARAGQATLRNRHSSPFLDNGPVQTQDGNDYIESRW